MARYECSVCGYVYDKDQEGVPWNALPGDWACPGCGAGKDLFTEVTAEVVTAEMTADVSEVSPPTSSNSPRFPFRTIRSI